MSIDSISGGSATTAIPALGDQDPAQLSAARAVKQDTVRISVGAQIKQLSDAGESAKEIAANLGVTEKEVQQALGDTTADAVRLASLVNAK